MKNKTGIFLFSLMLILMISACTTTKPESVRLVEVRDRNSGATITIPENWRISTKGSVAFSTKDNTVQGELLVVKGKNLKVALILLDKYLRKICRSHKRVGKLIKGTNRRGMKIVAIKGYGILKAGNSMNWNVSLFATRRNRFGILLMMYTKTGYDRHKQTIKRIINNLYVKRF